MNTEEVIRTAREHLDGLRGHHFDVLEVTKPVSAAAAANLAKIVSKLSPLISNLIEFNTCEYLNEIDDLNGFGHWQRQDPGFPDIVFAGDIQPTPGLEIKTWFPLATEITPRFKDSQNFFRDDNTYVALLAWLPEFLLFGKPKIIDILIASAASIAKARDDHYHNPPDYLVIEPGDTTARTANLQQTNTAGYKFQGNAEQFLAAKAMMDGWGADFGTQYSPDGTYQAHLAQLMAAFPYRLDTNFAKMDRIVHTGIEAFKTRVHNTPFHGRTIREWGRTFSRRGGEEAMAALLASTFGIGADEAESVVE